MRPTHLVPGAIGMFIAVVLNIRGWWLNDGSHARNLLIVLVIAALIIGFVGDPKGTVRREIALWVGFVVGMIAVLFAIGPGTIFPIVIAVGASLAALTILIGSVPAMFRAR